MATRGNSSRSVLSRNSFQRTPTTFQDAKLRDLVNASNENLRQYVRAYSELMLEIRHMHELDRVCHFVMGLPTWAKRKLEENWPASLTKAIMKVENFSV